MTISQRICLLASMIIIGLMLQGAGCTTHYSGRLMGTVTVPETVDASDASQTVTILYRAHRPDMVPCTDGWSECLRDTGWTPLQPCDALEADAGKTMSFVLKQGETVGSFDACTKMVGVHYLADVAAFVDLDGDGVLDPNEPWGGHEAGPVKRGDAERGIAIEIEIR